MRDSHSYETGVISAVALHKAIQPAIVLAWERALWWSLVDSWGGLLGDTEKHGSGRVRSHALIKATLFRCFRQVYAEPLGGKLRKSSILMHGSDDLVDFRAQCVGGQSRGFIECRG